MFLCTHRHSNLILFLAVQQTQALLIHDELPVGWGGVVTFMFLCTHRHSNLIIFFAVQLTQAIYDELLVGWGGVIIPTPGNMKCFKPPTRHVVLVGT